MRGSGGLLTTTIHNLRENVAVVGWACRFPGAHSISDLWSVLVEGRCTVTEMPADRFPLGRFAHRGKQVRGKSYTWAAGVLDDVFGFDPEVFGIAPREAEQMDPQQRLLLELTWEALEDAGIRPSSLAGKDIGVFVGASLTDYGNILSGDPALADAQFATGNSLAVLSNRISYVFDLKGPSLTIDTACSSSLVALHHAVEALRSGRVDTAIVGGVNVIASPAGFIMFSQASMLSPTGRCRAFSADADGFVRAEGGAVLVLRRAGLAQLELNPVHGFVLASDVNSDGRTPGILLPSGAAQEELVSRVYARSGIPASQLAFVEAHGTGTQAGDPIEAHAIGRALGAVRKDALPIGSIKTNIGHLEPASGIAGVIKSILALNYGLLPRSLHFSAPNPRIDFDGLGLRPADSPILLPNAAKQCAGVNSFGFGGTNAHVVVAGGKPADVREGVGAGASYFFISAKSAPALRQLAQEYRLRLAHLSNTDASAMASVAAYRRDHLDYRLMLPFGADSDILRKLDAFLEDDAIEGFSAGQAVGQNMPVAFVYSGNGAQWAGMGISAYRHNTVFRETFDDIDRLFAPLAGWSLRECMQSAELPEALNRTNVAQPLIFAIQVAATHALRESGIVPCVVLGHSVGEVAAAYASGAIDLAAAVKVIFFRSKHQEETRGQGRMIALSASADAAKQLMDDGASLEIAAFNSPYSITVAGSDEDIAAFRARARAESIATLDLGLEYPFHTAAMDALEAGLKRDLHDVVAIDGTIPFVSSVTGRCLPSSRLDGRYWWQNVREPVRFDAAVGEAARQGARFFIELGPRGLLTKHIEDILKDHPDPTYACGTLERHDDDCDPFPAILCKVLVAGAKVDFDCIFGGDPGAVTALPAYPWQRRHFRLGATVEAHGTFESHRTRYSGARLSEHDLEWHAHIDTLVMPELADHRVGEQTIFPGTGFLEMALSVAREWVKSDQIGIAEFEILKPLDLSLEETRHVMTRISPVSNAIEILSRPRLTEGDWLLNCRGKILQGRAGAEPEPETGPPGEATIASEIYRLTERHGLHYGPAFRLVTQARRAGDRIVVDLAEHPQIEQVSLDPVRLDACSHAMLLVFAELSAWERGVTYIPVRIDEILLFLPGAVIRRAVIDIVSKGERSILVNYRIFSEDGAIIAELRGVRAQAIPIRRPVLLEANAVVEQRRLIAADLAAPLDLSGEIAMKGKATELDRADLVLDAWAIALVSEFMRVFADEGMVYPERLIEDRRWPPEQLEWLSGLLDRLGAAGLTERVGNRWRLTDEIELPSATEMLQTLYDEHPECAADLLLAGDMNSWLARVKAQGRFSEPAIVTRESMDFRNLVGSGDRARGALLGDLVRHSIDWPDDRALRVLHIGAYAAAADLVSYLESRDALQTFYETDPGRCESTMPRRLRGGRVVEFLPDENFDLVLAVDGLSRSADLSGLQTLLAPGGRLLAVEAPPSIYEDVVLGLSKSVQRLLRRSAEQWRDVLARAGFKSVDVGIGEKAAIVISALSSQSLSAGEAGGPKGASYHFVPDISDEHLAGRLRNYLVACESGGDVAPVYICALPQIAKTCDTSLLTGLLMKIRAFAEGVAENEVPVWFVFNGNADLPVNRALWAATRVVANEYSNLRVHRVSMEQGYSDTDLAVFGRLIAGGTAETEIRIDNGVMRAIRIEAFGSPASAPVGEAATLERQHDIADRLRWVPVSRRAPGDDEVEVAVEASGLNFRDVMWMLGLLPDDILEDGFAGPTLGLECAGIVIRCGSKVGNFKVGDRVVGFIPSAFSTHVTVGCRHVMRIPGQITAAAAATIPVAFLTAHYGLVTLARLKAGEWVLIHSAAGAVGLAAIQIAQARGARIVATAGSAAKRDMLKALGIEHVLDSRSLAFVDEVRKLVPQGIDVVLNSLAGEAMERSLACLRPFGRFIELGKRDYIANTHIGLRPFRKNVSYFGVDVDQLVGRQAAVGRKVFAAVMKNVEKGVYRPLPHSVVPASDTLEAFAAMQAAAHIGKIVITPPRAVAQREAAFEIASDRTHVVTGGLGGFGLATAQWLVDRGARHLVLCSRSGPESEEAKQALRDFEAKGVQVLAARCDVSDRAAIEDLFARIEATMPPVCGVMHAAMVLDDALMSNLDAERVARVLRPKIAGANHLHELTQGMPLDYLVMFSSITTIFGNPGQANYVAANAYLEGLAQYRKRLGLPALAVGFGPISDVGVVARNEALQDSLRAVGGLHGMKSRDALDLLGQAMQRFRADPDRAVVTIAARDGNMALDRLPVIKSPTYAAWASLRAIANVAGQMDLRVLVREKEIHEVRELVADVVSSQVAAVLRTQPDMLVRTRALTEMGLDSLMALELGLNLEKAFGIEIPLTVSAADLTIGKLADRIVVLAGGGRPTDDERADTLAGSHLPDIRPEQVDALEAIIAARAK